MEINKQEYLSTERLIEMLRVYAKMAEKRKTGCIDVDYVLLRESANRLEQLEKSLYQYRF